MEWVTHLLPTHDDAQVGPVHFHVSQDYNIFDGPQNIFTSY